MRKELSFPYLRSCWQTLRQGDGREVGQLREVPVVAGGRARAEVERFRRRRPVLGLQHGAERRPRRKRLRNGVSILILTSHEVTRNFSHLPLELVERRRLGLGRVVDLPDLLRGEGSPRRRCRRCRGRRGVIDNCSKFRTLS